MGWIKRFPAENILLDVSLLIVAFLLPSANWLLSQHLTAAFWIAAPMQVIALFCAFYGRNSGRGPKAAGLAIFDLHRQHDFCSRRVFVAVFRGICGREADGRISKLGIPLRIFRGPVRRHIRFRSGFANEW